MILTVGSRDSQLARHQAEHVIDLLENQTDTRAELKTLESLGDENRDAEPAELDEIGIFTSRLDKKLLDGQVDLVVHSLKDCPTDRDERLEIGAIPPRGTPFDTLVGSLEDDLNAFGPDTVIGTSSVRRKANLLHHNPEITVKSCRGNVPTRLEKLNDENSDFDALVLAAAGLERLEVSERGRILRTNEILPPAGQGALAVMCRADRPEIKQRLETINHERSRRVCEAERAFLSRLGGGCEAPVGALARISNGTLELTGSVISPDGTDRQFDTIEGDAENARDLGYQLADSLIEAGARNLLDR